MLLSAPFGRPRPATNSFYLNPNVYAARTAVNRLRRGLDGHDPFLALDTGQAFHGSRVRLTIVTIAESSVMAEGNFNFLNVDAMVIQAFFKLLKSRFNETARSFGLRYEMSGHRTVLHRNPQLQTSKRLRFELQVNGLAIM